MIPRKYASQSNLLQSWRRMLPGIVMALLFRLLAQAQSSNTMEWKTNYYEVTGATFSEIRQSINRSRPWTNSVALDGLTVWHIEWQANFVPSADGCSCDSFRTKTAITVTLPRWTAPSDVSPTVKQQWGQFITSLSQHERGHSQIALGALTEMHKRIKEIRPDPDCARLRKTVNEVAVKTVDDFRKREKDYDERTAHGARQSAAPR